MELPDKVYIHKSQFWGLMTNEHNITKDDIEYIRKDALVKYLYEEKGYPITLNGELVHWDELTKHLTEYNNWKKDAFIKKVENYLNSQLYDWVNITNPDQKSCANIIPKKDFIEDFKNYMKGE